MPEAKLTKDVACVEGYEVGRALSQYGSLLSCSGGDGNTNVVDCHARSLSGPFPGRSWATAVGEAARQWILQLTRACCPHSSCTCPHVKPCIS